MNREFHVLHRPLDFGIGGNPPRVLGTFASLTEARTWLKDRLLREGWHGDQLREAKHFYWIEEVRRHDP